jgi:hypothetical protein
MGQQSAMDPVLDGQNAEAAEAAQNLGCVSVA